MAKKKIKRRGKMPPNMFEDGGAKQSWGNPQNNSQMPLKGRILAVL